MHRATYVPSPHPPYLAAESTKPRTETHSTGHSSVSESLARPLPLSTTVCQVWPLLKMSLVHTGHRHTSNGIELSSLW